MKNKYRILQALAITIMIAVPARIYVTQAPVEGGYRNVRSRGALTKGLLILTNSRSGSSFLGELFNQHPDAFYLYEPLISVALDNDTMLLEKLKSIVSCHFKDMVISGVSDVHTASVLKDCTKNNICFRTRSKDLCTPKYCEEPKQCRKCQRLTAEELSSVCRSKRVAAAKIIRLQDFKRIAPLLDDENLDVKILHLVRDPRGVLSSRQKVKTNVNMRATCQEILRNTKLGLLDTPKWMKEKYKLVRYEDIAISPMEMAKSIYDFVGLELEESVRKWIKISTQGEVLLSNDLRLAKAMKDSEGGVLEMQKDDVKKLAMSDAYSTLRRSSDTWRAWRNSISNADIDEVQTDCKDMMSLLGYRPIPSVGDEVLDALRPYDGNTLRRKVDPGC